MCRKEEEEKEKEKIEKEEDNINEHILNDEWVLWAHLPHDIDWTLTSYKKIIKINSIESALSIFENLPEALVKNCMLFLMRKGINPVWEDEKNKTGGCFSYKINSKNAQTIWNNLSYTLLGETLTSKEFSSYLNGITISPKKNFCIIKIWTANCEINNPEVITNIMELNSLGCIFKKHIDY